MTTNIKAILLLRLQVEKAITILMLASLSLHSMGMPIMPNILTGLQHLRVRVTGVVLPCLNIESQVSFLISWILSSR
jgi:hypothetical protein